MTNFSKPKDELLSVYASLVSDLRATFSKLIAADDAEEIAKLIDRYERIDLELQKVEDANRERFN